MKLLKLASHCLAAGSLVLSFQAVAYHPFITDDTGTQGMNNDEKAEASILGSGGNQLEIGYDYNKTRLDGSSDIGRTLNFVYTRGVAENTDLFIGAPWQSSSPNGWGNVDIGAKWRFYENEASELSLALKPEIFLPVSDSAEAKGLGYGKTSFGLTFIATQMTTFGELHFNAAYAHNDFSDSSITDRKDNWRISAAPIWAVAEGWKVGLDLGLQTNADRNEDETMGFVELGGVYSPNKQFDLSLGVIRDLMDGPVESTTVTTEITWHF